MWTLASLPVSLVLLVGAQIAAAQPRPISIRKMPPDSNEKLLDEYLAFGAGAAAAAASDLDFGSPHQSNSIEERGFLTERESVLLAANSSAQIPFRPAFGAHQEQQLRAIDEQQHEVWAVFRRAAAALAVLQRRQWSCPAGTSSCAAIGFQYYCCHTGETCYKVTSGAGPVGCCPSGANCGGSVGSCANGDTACPSALGGGCCIAGYVCQDVGCVLSLAPSSSPPAATSTTTSTDIISSHPSQSTIVVTVVVTQTQNGGTSLTTLTTTRTTTTGSQGGTTPTTPVATTTTTDAGSAALKPTFSGYCPTGFYACFASAGGGCCQTGRDCATTSCPPLASTTIVANGKTVVVPVTGAATASAARSTCAAGWFLCGPDAGPVAGCCPSGYACGTASCSLSGPSGTGTVQKVFPSGSGGGPALPRESRWWWDGGVVAFVLGVMGLL